MRCRSTAGKSGKIENRKQKGVPGAGARWNRQVPFYHKPRSASKAANEKRAYPVFLSHTEEGCETQPRDEFRKLSHTEGRSPFLKSPRTFRPRCQIRTFSRRQSRLNEVSATNWSDGRVILLNFRVKKDWRTIQEYLVLKRGYRSHLSRNLDQLSRKKNWISLGKKKTGNGAWRKKQAGERARTSSGRKRERKEGGQTLISWHQPCVSGRSPYWMP